MIGDQAIAAGHHHRGAQVGSGWTASVLDADGLKKLSPSAWDELARRSLIANPFYERPYLLAGIGTVDRRPVKALSVRCSSGRLVGLFPFEDLLTAPCKLRRSARNLYQFNGTPLVERDAAPFVVRSFLSWLAGAGRSGLWLIPNIDFGTPLVRLIEEEAACLSLATSRERAYRRAILTPVVGGLEAHLASVLSKSRLKDLKRNLRRLGEQGSVTFERADMPAKLEERLEQFLELEASGWKGKAGTAFLSHERHEDFARRAFWGMGQNAGRLVIDSLCLDGRPLAISLNIVGGDGTAFTPKCAYDENWRSFSPGLLLEYFVIQAFYEQQTFLKMDSATTVGGHVIAGLWNETAEMGDLIIRSRSIGGGALEGMLRLHDRTREAAKRLRDEWRSRWRKS